MKFLHSDIEILVVDDLVPMHRTMKFALEDLGFHNIIDAFDGEEAFKKLTADGVNVRLIISDLTMPKISGLEFLKKVRQDPRLRDTAFIMITGEQSHEQIVKAKDAGVTAYIVKPFSVKVLLEKLEYIETLYGKKKGIAS